MTKTWLRYAIRPIGIGDARETGMREGYLTDEYDHAGKRTVLMRNGATFERWYLFHDEYEVI